MEKIYSKVEPGRLLHIVQRVNEITKSRVDVIPADNFLQLAVLKMENDKTFRPHKHNHKVIKYNKAIAQESWVVIKGKVKCILYDLDDTILTEPVLTQGDASITLLGGHNFHIMQEDTIVYEFKTGPYEGQTIDKEFINE
tara:strand:+ start:1977 stop:2396 length:420 start_codon:yes stop_codon:yes gene_type:complete